jgi:hypothetical protein
MPDIENSKTEIADTLKQLKTAFDAGNCAVMDFWTDLFILIDSKKNQLEIIDLIYIANNYFRENVGFDLMKTEISQQLKLKRLGDKHARHTI